MHRLNFTLDSETVELLERLADKFYGSNKSATVRAALESLATHVGHEGWVVSGYTPVLVDADIDCHSCGQTKHEGETVYRPVFERGASPAALPHIPAEPWLDCSECVELQYSS